MRRNIKIKHVTVSSLFRRIIPPPALSLPLFQSAPHRVKYMSARNNRDAWLTASTNSAQYYHQKTLQACDDLDLFSLQNLPMHALSEVHLRLIVMKAHAPAGIVKYMVQNRQLCPSEALDVAAGPRMVKLLLSHGADPGKFTFFKTDFFDMISVPDVADDSRYAQPFRRSENLFPALSLRVLAGGVLPPIVREWVDSVAGKWGAKFIREHGSTNMDMCYRTFGSQFQAQDVAERIYDSSDSEDELEHRSYWPPVSRHSFAGFLAKYASYTKYLPIKLYVQSVRSSHLAVDKSVKMMLLAGATAEEVDTFVTGAEVKMQGKGKNKACCGRASKAKKIRGKVKKNDLYVLVQSFLDLHEDGVCDLVLCFL